MKNRRIYILALAITASFAVVFGLLLSCSPIDPFGEGPGLNSRGGDTSILVPNPDFPNNGGQGGQDQCASRPSTPSGVSASAQSSNSIRISWNSVSSATVYNVFRSTSASGTFSLVNTTSSTSFTNTGLLASTTYHYRVSAGNSCGESARSNSVSATTSSSCTAPSAPTGASASPQSTSSIRLSWNAVSGATHYRISSSTSSTGTFTDLSPATITSTSVNVTGLLSNTNYFFRIRAENSCGVSSNVTVSARTNAPSCAIPAVPTGVRSQANWWNEIQTFWNAVPGATSYKIYQSRSPNSGFTHVETTTATNIKIGWLAGSTTFYFRVTAVNSCGESALSSFGSATTGLFGFNTEEEVRETHFAFNIAD